MAVDRAIDSTEFDSKLTTVADAIRTAGGTTEPMSFPSGMVSAISELKGGGVEPFTKIISGTITFAEATTAFQLPETENFLAAYFIRTDFWGVQDEISDQSAQEVLFASGQSFGYFSPRDMSSLLFQWRDNLTVATASLNLSDGKLMLTDRIRFYGTYYYSLIYGTK